MIFIIDVNVVISALIKESKSRELLIDSPFILYAPETLISSVRKYKNLILEKSGLTIEEFETLFNLITEKITIIKKEDYTGYMEEALRLIGNADIEDVPYLALALSVPNDGIWSDDKHFKKQGKIHIFKTNDVIKALEN